MPAPYNRFLPGSRPKQNSSGASKTRLSRLAEIHINETCDPTGMVLPCMTASLSTSRRLAMRREQKYESADWVSAARSRGDGKNIAQKTAAAPHSPLARRPQRICLGGDIPPWPSLLMGRSEWTEAGSNRRHMDFQSIALPTELPVPVARTPAKRRILRSGRKDVNDRPELGVKTFSALRLGSA